MPTKAKQLLDMLGIDEKDRTYDDAVYGGDMKYGEPKIPLGTTVWDSLFPPLLVEEAPAKKQRV